MAGFPKYGHILDPQKVLYISDSDKDEFAHYGQEKLEYLNNAYGDGENPDVECTSEWEGLKKAV